MLDEAIIKMIETTWRICKWFFLQIFLMYLMPYLWNNHYNVAISEQRPPENR